MELKLANKSLLIPIVCLAAISSMLSFALWPVFLIQLGKVWNLSNTDIGWISGAYFFGYVCATPILVGLTDRVDAKWVFVGGSAVTLIGNFLFSLFAAGFWTAILSWSIVGAGLAGTYMPGLQILNGRLKKHDRIKAVPWYTSCFGIGTGGSYLLMGYIMINYDYQVAAMVSIIMACVGIIMISFLVDSSNINKNYSQKLRHPLDFRPVFKKKVSIGYILSYGAHTFELFAYRSWSFALFFFIGSSASPPMSIATITIIISAITLTGMIASVVGAKIAERKLRHKVISIVGISTFVTSIICAFLLDTIILAIAFLWIYNFFIMLDSGALTAGAVESSDDSTRGAVLAVHSMVGFFGGFLGGPTIGVILDALGGETSKVAWFCALIFMGVGSLIVFAIQTKFWIRKKAGAS